MKDIEDITWSWAHFKTQLLNFLPDLFGKVVTALIIYFVGIWLIKLLKRLLHRIFERRGVDSSVQSFLDKTIGIILKILLILTVVGKLGIQTTSFVAILGAAGLAVGLALQGSLSNFAGGILILIFRPFKVGDFISSSVGAEGTVTSIDIFHTHLRTQQNQTFVIPNGAMSNSNIKNFSWYKFRKTGIDIKVPYDADLTTIKEMIMDIVTKHPNALTEPAPSVTVNNIDANGINLYIEVSSNNENFFPMKESLLIALKDRFQQEKIPIFYTSQNVNLVK